MVYHDTYLSPLGLLLLQADEEGLTGLHFADSRFAPAQPAGSRPSPVLADAARWLDRYFAGACPDFTPRLSLRGTPFQQTVWQQLLRIPYGTTCSYGELAARVAGEMHRERMSAQAIGGAVGRNPVALIVPCHRVIGADGSLTGYAAGVERKAALLALESH